MKNLILITGAVRSGKSLLAESLARQSDSEVYYLATMPRNPNDTEQEQRIQRHIQRRPQTWKTVECPYTLAETIDELKLETLKGCCLIDCISLFISNLIVTSSEDENPYAGESMVLAQVEAVIHKMKERIELDFIVVTNEVGWGVVPETQLGRAFRDFLGMTNQRFAQEAETVWLTCAGLPLKLKPPAISG